MSCRRWTPWNATRSAAASATARAADDVRASSDDGEDPATRRPIGAGIVAGRATVEDERAGAPSTFQTLDRIVRPWRVRVAGRREHDPDRRHGQDRQPGTLETQGPGCIQQVTASRRQQQRPQRDRDPRQDRLRLRVAEPGVALEQDRAVRRQHEASVERATERGAASGQLGQDRAVEPVDQVIRRLVGEIGQRRVRAHPAGVGADVAIAEPLVIAGDRQGQRVASVAQGDEAGLTAVEPFLDDDLAGRVGDGDRPHRLFGRLADGDALARGEPIRLDDDPPTLRGETTGEGAGLRRRLEGT